MPVGSVPRSELHDDIAPRGTYRPHSEKNASSVFNANLIIIGNRDFNKIATVGQPARANYLDESGVLARQDPRNRAGTFGG